MSLGPLQIVGALRRSDQVYYAQLGTAESMPCGLAFSSPQFPQVADANQIRDVTVNGSAQDAYSAVEAYFAAHACRCLRWALSTDESPDAVAAHLGMLGWSRRDRVIWGQ